VGVQFPPPALTK